MTIPGRVPWVVHRIAVAPEGYRDTLHTILSEWSLADVVDANEVLDALDDARVEAARKARQK